MISRNRARSGDGREIPETVISKTVRKKMTQGNAKNPKKGSKKLKEAVLEKWRGALVKARLALNKKREKKKERYARSTLARLRKIADAARKKPPGDEEKAPNKKSPSEKKGRLPFKHKLRAVRKAQVLEAAATEEASPKILRKAKATSGRSEADGEHSLNGILRKAKAKSGRSQADDGEHSLNGIFRKAKAKSGRSQADDGGHSLNGILRKVKTKSGSSQADDGEHSRNGEPNKSITKVKRGRKPSPGNAVTDLKSITIVKRGRKSSPRSAATDPDEGLVANLNAELERKEEVKNKWRNTTVLDEGQAAKMNAEMERKEEVKNKWRNTLKIARFALQQKRERKKEQAQNVAIRRLRKCQCEGAVAPDNDIVQVGLSLKRPSLEELRNFAKKSRS